MSHRVDSVVRGYHVYKDDWVPGIGDTFQVEVEETNVHDRFACAVIVNSQIVGHVPRELSRIVFYFIKNNGIVRGSVTGRRTRSTVHMKGLEIPCVYEFTAEQKKINTLKKLLRKKRSGTLDICDRI